MLCVFLVPPTAFARPLNQKQRGVVLRQMFTASVLSALMISVPLHAERAPDFALRAVKSGQVVELSDFEGQVVYLDFWASWCGSCLLSFPAMTDWQARFGGERFTVVAINLDEDRDAAIRFLEGRDIEFPVLVDDSGSTPVAYDLPGLPTSFLIDRQGEIILRHAGFKTSLRMIAP